MKMKKILWMIISLAAALLPVSCNGFLDQLPSGDGYADNMAWRDRGSAMWRFCTGASTMSDDPLSGLWTRDYTGIYYCNLFLHESLGLGMRYMVNAQADKNLRSALQGDAFGLRAWFLYELLKYYGGRSTAGDLLGVPVFTEPVDPAKADLNTLRRATYDDCMKQILADCDSALKYLPLANRDFLKEQEMIPVLGAVRYRRLDGISVKALKALALLTWASPAFNPLDDRSRYDAAARLAKEVIDFNTRNSHKVSYKENRDKRVELVNCPFFTTNIIKATESYHADYSKLDSFVVIMCIDGEATITENGIDGKEQRIIKQGNTVLVPATTQSTDLEPINICKILEVYIRM